MSLYFAHVTFEFIAKAYLSAVSSANITALYLKDYKHSIQKILNEIYKSPRGSKVRKEQFRKTYNKYAFLSAKQEEFKYIPRGTAFEILEKPIHELIELITDIDKDFQTMKASHAKWIQ